MRGNKRHGLLQSSAGLPSYNLRITDSEASGNGFFGFSFSEELNFFCKRGIGTNGIFTKGNTLKNNGAGGKRFGTYDNVGIIQNVTCDDDVIDNQGFGVLVQTNADADAAVARMSINSAIIGNPTGIGIGLLVNDSVKWNALKVSGNPTQKHEECRHPSSKGNRLMPRATLTASLRALEVIRDDGTKRLLDAGMVTTAAAHKAIIDNAIRAALDLALAIKAAAEGDMAPAWEAIDAFALNQIEVR